MGLVGVSCGLAVSGCLSGPTEGDFEGDMDEEEFDEFISAKSDADQAVEKYRISVDTTIIGNGRSASMSVEGDVNGSVPVARLRYDIDAPGPPSPGDPRGEFDTYMNHAAVYIERGNQWERYSFEEFEELERAVGELWDIDHLTVGEDLYYYGDVTVEDTTDYIHVKTEVTGEELEEIEGSTPERAVPGLDEVEGGAIDVMVFEERVDPETKYPREVVINGEMSGGDHSATLTSTIGFVDHGHAKISTIPDDIPKTAVEGEWPTPF